MHILDCVSMPTGFVQFTQNAGLFFIVWLGHFITRIHFVPFLCVE